MSYHFSMKTRNWKRLTMFQRYFSPTYRKQFRTRLVVETTLIAYAAFSSSSRMLAISLGDTYGIRSISIVSIELSMSRSLMNVSASLNLLFFFSRTMSLSGSVIIALIWEGSLNMI